MINLKTTALPVCLCIALFGGAQTDSTKSKKVNIRFIQIQDGATFCSGYYINKTELQSMLINPSSNFYFNDNGYNEQTGKYHTSDLGLKVNTAFSVGEKQNQLVKVGLGFLTTSPASYYSTKKEIKHLDTLQGTKGYNPIYVDSVINYTYGINTNVSILSLDLEYGMQTNDNKRFIYSVGARVSPFYSIINRASSYNDRYQFLKLSGTNFEHNENSNNSSPTEISTAIISKLKASYGLMLGIPVAINFKPKKAKHAFGKHSAVGLEMSPELRLLKMPGQSLKSNFNFTAHISYRYYFKAL